MKNKNDILNVGIENCLSNAIHNPDWLEMKGTFSKYPFLVQRIIAVCAQGHCHILLK